MTSHGMGSDDPPGTPHGYEPEHHRLEDRLDLPHRLTTPRAYRALLARFYGYYAPLEALLGARGDWESVGLDFAPRRKVPALTRDLHALGLADDALAALPRCPRLPTLATFPQALGCLYVLEGATLGGQLIARQIGRTLAIDATSGGAFFRAYGDAVGPMWRAFGAAISTYPADPATAAAIVAAARATFNTLEHWLLDDDPTALTTNAATADAARRAEVADRLVAAARGGRRP